MAHQSELLQLRKHLQAEKEACLSRAAARSVPFRQLFMKHWPRLISGDDRGIDGADRDSGNPVRMSFKGSIVSLERAPCR